MHPLILLFGILAGPEVGEAPAPEEPATEAAATDAAPTESAPDKDVQPSESPADASQPEAAQPTEAAVEPSDATAAEPAVADETLSDDEVEPTPASEPTPAVAESTETVGTEEIRAAPSGESAPVPAPAADVAPQAAGVTSDATVGATVRDVNAENPYWVTGWLEYRTLLVSDSDPLNGMSLWGHVKAGYRLFDGAKAYLRVGFVQGFVTETGAINGDIPLMERFLSEAVQSSGESGFDMVNFRLGFEYTHSVDLEPIPVESAWLDDHAVTFVHRIELLLPTSRESRVQELWVAPRYLNLMRLNPVWDLTVGWDALLQYNFYRFAERAGLGGDLNTQFVAYGALNVQWVFDELPFSIPGDIAVSFDVFTVYEKKYDSAQMFASDLSSTSFWHQDFGWDFYVDYTPVEFFTFEVALEQGSPFLRSGIRDLTLFHRDETEFVTRLIGRY